MSKKQVKTDEELLKEALVPVEEQPYEIPSHWKWVRLDGISSLITDGSHNPPAKKSEGIPMLSGRNITNNEITFDTDRYITQDEYQNEYKRTPVEKGDILLTIVGSIGRSAIVNTEELFALQRSVALIKLRGQFNKYIQLYFKHPVFQSTLDKNAKGTAQKGIYLKTLKQIPIPFPPLEEQKRIADKIERMLDKINQSKQLIEEAKQTFELRRAAILEKAFSGELTQKWREENSDKVKSIWTSSKLSEVFMQVSDTVEPSGIEIYIGLEHLSKGGGIAEVGKAEELKSTKNTFVKGDVLYGKLRPYLNKHAIVDFEGICSTDIVVLRTRGDILPEYLDYFLGTPYVLEYASMHSKGINLPRLSIKDLMNMKISYPNQNEQVVILDKLHEMLNNEGQVYNCLKDILEKEINQLEKSILSKAFKGEL